MSLQKFGSALLSAAVLILGGISAKAQRPLGIDVSSYQGGSINWTNVKNAGITFAWAKAAEGLSIQDADFAVNETHAKSAGVLIGAYYYAHPELEIGTSGADSAAAYFWNIASPYIKTNGFAYLMPMLDFEQDVNSASPAYTQATLSDWVNEWCQDIVNYGKAAGVVVTPIVYTYISYADGGSGNGPGLDSTVTQWPLWMANYQYNDPQTGRPSGTSPWSTWMLWQYCTTNVVSGVSGAVDQDVFNGTFAAFTNNYVIGKGTAPAPSGLTNYWDPGLTIAYPGSGGTGTWNTSTSNWWSSGTNDTTWSFGGDYGVFGGTAGTITLNTSVAVDGLTFITPGYTISGTGSMTLGGASPTISVPPGSPTYFNCTLSGSGFTLTGGGVAVFNNAGNATGNSSSAQFIVGPNTTLVVGTDHDVGNGGVTLNLEHGGIYQNNDTAAGDAFLLSGSAIALLSGGGIFDNPNANLTMSDFITGPGSLTIIGTTHTLTLSDTNNNYTGGTIVQSGTLLADAAGAMGSKTGALTVNGGTLNLNGASHAVGPATFAGGTVENGSLTASSYSGQSGTVSAVLAGTAGITKTTTGTLTLGGNNSYTGATTISAGTLALASSGSISHSTSINLAAGATLDVSTQPAFTLGSTTTFYASGNSAPATLNGGANVSFGSRPIVLTFDGADPALTIAEGSLALNGNAFTVNGSTLKGGSYVLIQQASGNISSTGTFSASGTAIPQTNAISTISVSGGNVILTVSGTVPVTVSNAVLAPAGGVQMTFSGQSGYTYYIQATTNLAPPAIWITVSTNVADTNGNFTFTDASATNYTDRFYRTSTQP